MCGDEFAIFEAASQLFQERGAQLLGISVDGVWCHQAFRADHKIEFPLLSDFHPKGEVARAYGVYRDEDGVTERALFVIDRDRKIAWSYVSPIGVNPGADGALKAVELLFVSSAPLRSCGGRRDHRRRTLVSTPGSLVRVATT